MCLSEIIDENMLFVIDKLKSKKDIVIYVSK